MPGDYTRFTYDAHSDYAGVFKQQGRVDLDADFNELIDIVDRRWRAETIDIIGHGVVPRVPPATPPAFDPFLVIPSAIGDFQIGIGRMYVDGILVENHGLEPFTFRADLGESRGTIPPSYSNQPYLPAPLPPVLPGTAGTSDLIYIDVWQREVTALEDPSLREIALGGPDTTTRLQNVWQVRALQDVGNRACGDSIPAWDDLIAPSAGRLTVTALAPPASDDPCILSPNGGYRGLENRLYRVEIHAPGTIGGGAPARFKWARDNANVAASVAAIPAADQIVVQQLGRDEVLRFAPGNWIEITDDHREFQGLGGHMAQIATVDEANRTITFAPAIGGMSFNPADPSRHTRVRRWDSNGLLDVLPGPNDIEHGIRVEFSLDPAGGDFHIGDYWCFAARTADGSVEELDRAPPRGILHHFVRLGFIHWGATLAATTFTDCRVRWPPINDCGCCTVTVGDGVDSFGDFTDIQQAIDALGTRGGLVCIGRGFWRLTEGLRIDTRNVIVRGMGPATRIVFAPGPNSSQNFLEITNTEEVRLENVFVASGNAEALVRLNGASFCRFENCTLVNLSPRDDQNAPAPRALEFAERCSNILVSRCVLVAGKAVSSLTAELRELQVRDSLIRAQRAAVFIMRGNGIEIVHNQIRGLPRGALGGIVSLDRGTIDAFQVALNQLLLSPSTFANLPGIGIMFFSGNRVVITQNLISAQLAVAGFMLINARIQQNDIVSLVGVLLMLSLRVKVEDNFLFGLLAGLLQGGVAFDLDVTSNEMLGLFGILFMSPLEAAVVLILLLLIAFGAGGFGGAAAAVIAAALAVLGALLAVFRGVGLVLCTKMHRNVFLTFSRGIMKSNRVLSLDMSIVDNSFSLCTAAAIELGVGPNSDLFNSLRRAFSLRHLVQGNAITVQGKGVVSATAFTEVVDNDIQSRLNGVELDAPSCSVRDNLVINTVEGQGPDDSALVVLHGGSLQARVSGNRLTNSASHAVLITENILDLIVEDNQILLARGFAVGTLSDNTLIDGARIARNRIEGCGSVTFGAQFRGVLRFGRCVNLSIIDNEISGNPPTAAGPGTSLQWAVVYCDNVFNLDLSGNRITGNLPFVAATQGFFTALYVDDPRASIRIENNVIRGNAGSVMELMPLGAVPVGERQHMCIQNNHLSAGIRRTFWFMRIYDFESMLFQGNRCDQESSDAFSSTPPMYMFGDRANVSNNMVNISNPTALYVNAQSLLVNANTVESGERALEVRASPTAAARLICTSNITTGLVTASTGLQITIHNFS